MNYRLLCNVLAKLLGLISLSMLVAVPFAIYYREWKELIALIEALATGLAISGVLHLIGWKPKGDVYRREALAIVGLGWILAGAIGALPFIYGGLAETFTDAYFESVSGLTTTGSTILTDIESQAKSLLLWRSFLHFLGGLGIIVLFVAVLPMLGVGARALFKQEVPGPVPEGLTPRIKDTAMRLWKLYLGLNILEAILLMIAGMTFYDAVNHAMATMATGGFSTRNTSILAFYSPAVEWIIILFMYLAGVNFTLHLQALRGRFDFYRNPEWRTYTAILVFSTLFVVALLTITGNTAVSKPGGINVRDAFFTVVAIQTTTGFGTVDFDQWPNAIRGLLCMLMFVGGCAGSTGGGIKVIRWVILWKLTVHELASNVSPRRVRVLKLGGRTIQKETSNEVMIFFFIYLAIAMTGTVVVAFLMPEMSLVTCITSVFATLNNIGPGLEAVGPTMNYSAMSIPTKWVLSLFMVLGRIELYAVLVLFSRRFWTGQ